MTECQGCGAWNESHRALCVLCGTPLAETDEWDATAELPPLPPLPDGGLAASMPSWLRDAPALDLAPAEQSREPALLGPRVDPRTFLTDDDFPQWLRDLAVREPRRAERPAAMPEQTVAAPARSVPAAPAWPSWPESAATSTVPSPAVPSALTATIASAILAPAATEPDAAPAASAGERPLAAVVAAEPLEEPRGRDAWETLLLVLLFLGVVVAALWALVANGVFNPGV